MISAAPTYVDWQRAFLRKLAWDAEETSPSTSLLDHLKATCRAKVETTDDGRSLVAFAANGHSYQYQTAPGVTPTQVAALTSWLYDLCVEARVELVAEGTASPTDAQILERMLASLVPVRPGLIDRSGVVR